MVKNDWPGEGFGIAETKNRAFFQKPGFGKFRLTKQTVLFHHFPS